MREPAGLRRSRLLATVVGFAAVGFAALYLLSDVVEWVQGGFSDSQLWLTLLAEAAIPALVLGLFLLQRPAIGRLGLFSAMAYAYSFVYFTGTVAYALIRDTGNYGDLSEQLQPWMTIHGGIMVLAGLGFGIAVITAGVLPRWTGAVLMAGVVLVAISQNWPAAVQVVAAGIRDLAFAGMGVALLRSARFTPARPRSTTAAGQGGLVRHPMQ